MRAYDEEEQEFERCFTADGRIRDGVTRIRVPVRLIDSAGDLPQGKGKSTHDAVADYIRARQLLDRKPGFVPTATLRTAWYNSMYDAYDETISGQWQTGQGSHGFAGSRVGDLCTVRFGRGKFGPEGAPGTLQLVDGELRCVADGFEPAASGTAPPWQQQQEVYSPSLGAVRKHGDAAHDSRDAEYSRYDFELANAWRRRAT